MLGEAAIARGFRELARGAWPVHEAAIAEDALALLAAEEIGTLVCDLDSAPGDPAAALDHYARLMRTPGKLRAKSAKKRREEGAEAGSLLGRIKALGGRFASMLGKI